MLATAGGHQSDGYALSRVILRSHEEGHIPAVHVAVVYRYRHHLLRRSFPSVCDDAVGVEEELAGQASRRCRQALGLKALGEVLLQI